MTDVKLRDLIERLRELEAKAAAAPWKTNGTGEPGFWCRVDRYGGRVIAFFKAGFDYKQAGFDHKQAEADATFIAETRNALPELLSALQSLVERNAAMEEALKSSEAWLTNWGQHVGNCRGGALCMCGLEAMRHEARSALPPEEQS